MRPDPLIFLSAGEASGDHYGAALIHSLREKLPQARFTGLGGTAMAAAGQLRLVRAEDVAVMGITEILAHLPRILRAYRTLVRAIHTHRPDAAVLIDFPDVNFRLAKHLYRLGIPVLWFVSPQLWAWKRRRLRWVQSRVTQMLTIFPFEEPFYRNRHVLAEFVGHPLAELPVPTISREDFATQHALHANQPWVALLPGSRPSEFAANLPTLLQTAALLGPAYEYLLPVAPTIPTSLLDIFQNSPNPPRITLVHDARAALLHARAAVIASGTATVQAAVLGTPFVTVYRVSATTFAIAKRLVRYPPEIPAQPDVHGNLPIAMPNLIAGRRIVPELLQQHFTPANVAQALRPLLQDTHTRRQQRLDLAEVRRRLLPPSGIPAITRLRDAVLHALETRS